MDSFLDLFKTAGQTAVDIIAAQNSGPVTSAGPNTNPQKLTNQALANGAQQTANPSNYTPLIIGGAVLVGVLVLVVVLKK